QRFVGLAKGVAALALAKLHLNISIDSLGRGHHIECKDLDELIEAEDAVMTACRSLKAYLALASTFNGSIILIDFDQGEQQHISQGTLELPSVAMDSSESRAIVPANVTSPSTPGFDFMPYKPVGYELAAMAVAFLFFKAFWVLLFGGLAVFFTASWIRSNNP